MNVLLLGSGGREHTLAWKIAQSKLLSHLFIAPGNAGTANHGTNVDLDLTNFETIARFLLDMKIEMLVVGPEQPLVDGLYDYLKSNKSTENIRIVGMNRYGAQLEGSKDFAKTFMQKNQIPTAKYQSFDQHQVEQGIEFLKSLNAPYVLKADGLAAGKGVLILNNLDEAISELQNMLLHSKFGAAGNIVVIEEFLQGIELSAFILTDGKDYLLLPEAKDYKRIGVGDTGLNTGGMGSISPVPFADKAFMEKVEHRIIKPTVKGLQSEGFEYTGFVFIGLMNVNGNPYVIEYNVRLGDPETESVIPRIESDLLEVFNALFNGKLTNLKLEINPNYTCTVIMVSGGYPEKYEKGKLISGLRLIENSMVFHAGTLSDDDDQVFSNGGRVLAITSMDTSLEKAIEKSYKSIAKLKYEGHYFRTDIGKDLL
jgi:phosphoribosylamine--glycine ligase